MENKMKYVTEQELDTLRRRTGEILKSVEKDGNVVEGIRRYVAENGYSEEEAVELIEHRIIPAVDRYNSECREYAEDGTKTWILDKVSEKVEDMSLSEECEYKMGLLIALRARTKEILEQAALHSMEEMETMYEELSQEKMCCLEEGSYSEEILEQINEQLAEAIQNSGFEMELLGGFEELINSNMDEENVHGFVTEMWKDEQYKYCAAAAACVAKKNNELPSIPEGTSDIELIVGVCQGIDTANIEMKVSNGEMAADAAYEILRVVAEVGLLIVGFICVITAIPMLAESLAGVTVKLFGNGIFACLVGGAIGCALCISVGSDLGDILIDMVDNFGKISDFTYEKLKKGAKVVSKTVRERVIPKVRSVIETMTLFIHDTVASVHRAVAHRHVSV